MHSLCNIGRKTKIEVGFSRCTNESATDMQPHDSTTLCLTQSIYHGADVLIKTISGQENISDTLVQNFSDTTVLAIKKYYRTENSLITSALILLVFLHLSTMQVARM